MENIRYDLITALPEIVIVCMAMFILLADLFLKSSNRIAIYVLAQVTLLVAAYLTFSTHTPSVGYAFTGTFVDDAMADVLKLMIYLGTSLIFVYSRQYIQLREMYRGEFYALVLFSVVGMMIMVSGQNMLTLYVGLELLSLSLYALVALDRDNARATEAAMKYFVLGALASGMLLYGMSMIYGMTGSLNISEINNALMGGENVQSVLILGLVFIVAGLAFKLGAVPFQMWVPDVYEGSPTAITLLISSVPKLAAFAFIIRMLEQGLHTLAVDWQQMLMIMAVLSIVIGNVTAIAQTNLKRMLAYSTISHVGFVLFGLMSASINGFTSALFYIVSYVLMTLAGFGMILLLSRKGFEAEKLDDLKGLNQRSPWHAFLMLIVMFSMAGVPPTLGFYAKFTVLQAALQAGFLWLVVFAVLMAVIGAFYYLRVIKLMYFDEPVDHHPIQAPMDMRIVLGVNALALLAIGLMPQGLMELCSYAISKSLG
ncbi:NADH-quinone oxidoreductase subunit NuoN [Methylotenera sp.]|uniref:NADH-quinone oxidoreductase subunit NuoN n=1 Tax=Methylotenera sp. TaxID=2051956 RepID=UPI0027275F7D|nr:NADH-quinone oxidoreductase subunit NuoN [Methylotenera sp.]MDO9206533.1 NADH-quinone oxidoreductase subunit NuoN [Methylotenera sp.]MDO9393478.1 NADH-quinone oxidoreductase subunit NuoN [Methylotenera sp.]MDP2072280.1 NADH-quinone oxidoreductase subunit NuoN [Methylotenera sp.]MDP2231047.1 NADH-quinone oxidoreductase subunit NuoN [Methylotenera sp.]MDP3005079.1 NADH-quinone oxidoreductase subunit NuoN [Methylotenera sp.]